MTILQIGNALLALGIATACFAMWEGQRQKKVKAVCKVSTRALDVISGTTLRYKYQAGDRITPPDATQVLANLDSADLKIVEK